MPVGGVGVAWSWKKCTNIWAVIPDAPGDPNTTPAGSMGFGCGEVEAITNGGNALVPEEEASVGGAGAGAGAGSGLDLETSPAGLGLA